MKQQASIPSTIHLACRYLIASIWLINGLFCKVMLLVPRHKAIIARILGPEHSLSYTLLIGISETAMAIWIISGLRSRLCSLLQIIIIATMNIIEWFTVPDLLLFGRYNALLALVLILVIGANEYFRHDTHSRSLT